MFHYNPVLHNTEFTYPSQVLSPRDKYLAALAEAKAAEAEYLAAEAIQQEEAALRQRLQEIQLQKQQGHVPSTYPYPSTTSFSVDSYQDRSPCGYELLAAHRQLEEAEIRRRAVEEQERVCRQAEEQVRLRLQAEQKERLRASVAAQQAELQQFAHPQIHNQGARHQYRRPERAEKVALHPFLKSILGQDALTFAIPAQAQQKLPAEASDINQVLGSTLKAPKPATNVDDIFNALCGVKQGQLAAPKPTVVANQPERRAQPTIPTAVQYLKADPFKQTLDLFLGGGEQTIEAVKPRKTSQAASPASVSKPQPAEAHRSGAQDLPHIFNLMFGRDASPTQKQQPKPPTASEASKPKSVSVQPSLKAQLESRLSNEHDSEVRDTIQTLLFSLHSAATLPSASSKSRAKPSSKGKVQAPESNTTSRPSSNPNSTSPSVSKSLNAVRNIEETFHLLQSEFVFPSQLDFLVPPSSKTPTPASSDTESVPSSIEHLSYTSRNNPVRHYEQSLGALISQLDAVESFGSEALRAMRKNVIGRVERALEDLESEVEGRWKARVAEEVTTQEPAEVEAEIVAAPSPSEATPTEPVREAVAPEVAPAPVAANDGQEILVEDSQPAVETGAIVASSPSDVRSEEPSSSDDVILHSNEFPSQASSIIALSPTPTSPETSAATIKPYDVSPVDVGEVDTFLLPASATPDVKAKPSFRDDEDAGSDWSEVEA